jgi:hypothetical protein
VFFYSNDVGGCALFDDLGPPWPLHDCWIEHQDARRRASLRSSESLSSRSLTGTTKPPVDKLTSLDVVRVLRGTAPSQAILAKEREREQSFWRTLRESTGSRGRKSVPRALVKEAAQVFGPKILRAFQNRRSLDDIPTFLWRDIQRLGKKVWLESHGFLPSMCRVAVQQNVAAAKRRQ